MSECLTKVERIKSIEKHPNADKLELALCRGWHCVVPKDTYKAGDLCVYIPIDSVLPSQLETALLGNSAIKLSKGRIKTIKLRGAISQGLIVDLGTVNRYLGDHGCHLVINHEGLDITKELGIKKWEPELPEYQKVKFGGTMAKTNPHFHKYTSLENHKNYPDLFGASEIVNVTEKIHGTNFRAGWVPKIVNGFWKNLALKMGIISKHEFVFGSHNVQLSDTKNIYYKMVEKYSLKKKLKPGEVIYGEIYGHGIQKNYSYGLKEGEQACVFFDIKKDNEWLNYLDLLAIADEYDLPTVPRLYVGRFDQMNINKLFAGSSLLSDDQKVKEGFVVSSYFEEKCYLGRKKIKFINPEYLLKDNTDYH